MKFLSKKNYLRIANNYFFLKFLYSYSIKALIIDVQIVLVIFGSIFLLYMSYKIAINSSLDNQKSTNPITFTKMFFFQYINPKGVLMSVVIISSFIDINSNYLYDASILILLGIFFAYSSIISWCLFGSLIRKFLNNKNKVIFISLAVLIFAIHKNNSSIFTVLI